MRSPLFEELFVLTPRAVGIFALIFAVVLFAEWFEFLRGFDTGAWPASNWVLLAFVIITRTVDRSLPDTGSRVAKDTRQPRRPSSRR